VAVLKASKMRMIMTVTVWSVQIQSRWCDNTVIYLYYF